MKRAILPGLLLALLFTPQVQAAYDPVGGGSAKLTLDKSFSSFLAKNGIKLLPSQGAKKKGSSYLLPVAKGNLDPTTAKGEIDTEGTLAFQVKRAKVPLREITIKTKPEPLVAKVGGSQLKVASSKRSFKRVGFDSTFTAKTLKLTQKAITRLNKKLRPKEPFKANQELGTLIATAEPKLVTILEQNKASVVFDSAFLAKLSSHFVSLNPIFPAEHVGPSFSFPISAGGSLSPIGTEGTLRSGGVIELLQLGGGQVFWQELWADLGAKSDTAEVDLEPTPAFPGKIGRTGVFEISGGAFGADPAERTLSLSGATLALTAQTAKALNDAFAEGQALFGAGEVAGSLSFSAQGQ